MADNEAETLILHEVGEVAAGESLGEQWGARVMAVSAPRSELLLRAVRDLLADCFSTLPGLLRGPNVSALHFYFATFDAQRRVLFPEAMAAYEHYVRTGETAGLFRVAQEGAERWLAVARELLALDESGLEGAAGRMLGEPGARSKE
jgi:hypothetical protein